VACAELYGCETGFFEGFDAGFEIHVLEEVVGY
jgi:hypothetical protein